MFLRLLYAFIQNSWQETASLYTVVCVSNPSSNFTPILKSIVCAYILDAAIDVTVTYLREQALWTKGFMARVMTVWGPISCSSNKRDVKYKLCFTTLRIKIMNNTNWWKYLNISKLYNVLNYKRLSLYLIHFCAINKNWLHMLTFLIITLNSDLYIFCVIWPNSNILVCE